MSGGDNVIDFPVAEPVVEFDPDWALARLAEETQTLIEMLDHEIGRRAMPLRLRLQLETLELLLRGIPNFEPAAPDGDPDDPEDAPVPDTDAVISLATRRTA
jgi:hypothetical protein